MWRTLLVLAAFFALLSTSGFAAPPQPSAATVVVLDRPGQPTARITDGDTVRLRLVLSSPVSGSQSYTFKLDNLGLAVGTCDIVAASSCETDPAPSLGWHWDPGGLPRQVRVVSAYDAQGARVARSGPLAVLPRPVVMVHGFISAWNTWKPYLGPDGFLAPLGIRGFAVGDGQVPGVMNTGVITDPAGATNTIAQNAAIEGQYIAAVKKATGADLVISKEVGTFA